MKSFLVALVFELVSQDLNLLSHKSYDFFFVVRSCFSLHPWMTYPFPQHRLEREKPFMSVCFLFVMAFLIYVSQRSLASFSTGLRCLSFVSHLSLVCSQFNRAQESCLGDEHLGPDFCSHCRDEVSSEVSSYYSSLCSLISQTWPPGLRTEAHLVMDNCQLVLSQPLLTHLS